MTVPHRRMPRVRPGEEVRAEHINAVFEAAERLGISVASNVAGGLVATGNGAGTHLSLRKAFRGFVKLTSGGTGGKYAWTSQIATSSGGWTSGFYSGTTAADPAYAANGETTIAANTIVLAERTTAGGTIVFVF